MKKTPKVILATTLGAALLLGGSTYALWTSNVTPTTNATIQTGGIGVTALTDGVWEDAVNDVTIDPATFKAVPGDNLTYTQSVKSTADGAGDYTLSASQSAAAQTAADALAIRGVTLTIRFVDATTGADITTLPATLAAGVSNLSPSVDFSTTGVSLDKTVKIKFTYDFASSVTADDTKNMQTVVEDTQLQLDAK